MYGEKENVCLFFARGSFRIPIEKNWKLEDFFFPFCHFEETDEIML